MYKLKQAAKQRNLQAELSNVLDIWCHTRTYSVQWKTLGFQLCSG